MEDHIQLKKEVLMKMIVFKEQNVNPTAKELYNKIKKDMPFIERRYGFRSFARILPIFHEIKGQSFPGTIKVYMLKI